jgi:transposase
LGALDPNATFHSLADMPFEITQDEGWKLVHLRQKGLSIRGIEKHVDGMHRKSQIARVIKDHSKHETPPTYRQHTRHKQVKEKHLDEIAKDRLEFIIDCDPCLYIDEATEILNRKFGYKYKDKAVTIALNERGYSLKAVSGGCFGCFRPFTHYNCP